MINQRKYQYILISFIVLLGFNFSSCGLNKESRTMRALKDCKYELVGVDSLILSGMDIAQLLDSKNQQINLSGIPAIAMGYLSQNLPLSAKLQLEITNPTNRLAGIRQFEYIILLDGMQLLEGTSNLPISVPSGSTVVVPVHLQANVYPLLSNGDNLQRVLNFINGSRAGASNNTTDILNLTLRLKPTITLANQAVQYPGYINVERSIDRATLLRILSR